MSVTRGYVGKDGGDYVIAFTVPGVDYFAASDPEDFIFRSDYPQLRALVEGELLGAPTGKTNILLPKTFLGLPLMRVVRYVSTDYVLTPSAANGFEVGFLRNTDYFYINNLSGGLADFRYIVFDNEIV